MRIRRVALQGSLRNKRYAHLRWLAEQGVFERNSAFAGFYQHLWCVDGFQFVERFSSELFQIESFGDGHQRKMEIQIELLGESHQRKMEIQIELLGESHQRKVKVQIEILTGMIQEEIKTAANKAETQMDVESQLEALGKKIKNVNADLASLKGDLSTITDLHLHTAKLITMTSCVDHFELEMLKERQKRGQLSDYDANKTLIAEIEEENFDRYVEENFSNKPADRFLALST